MSVLSVTVIAILLSLTGVALLSAQNAKRRRAAGLSPHTPSRRQVALGYLLLLAPLPVLIAQGQTTPFILWFAAVSVAGWIIALRRPSQ